MGSYFQEKQGDLFSSDAAAIGHGVNCRGAMGAGIAKQFRERYPEMYAEYVEECRSGRLSPGTVFPYLDAASDRLILNIASQNSTGRDANLSWLLPAFAESLRICRLNLGGVEFKFAIPQIGCGIGGLDWQNVAPELEKLANLYEVAVEAWYL